MNKKEKVLMVDAVTGSGFLVKAQMLGQINQLRKNAFKPLPAAKTVQEMLAITICRILFMLIVTFSMLGITLIAMMLLLLMRHIHHG